jgi:uncharacterized Zn finger protein
VAKKITKDDKPDKNAGNKPNNKPRWWNSRWMAAIDAFGEPERMTRGRTYARQGAVFGIDIAPGEARAQVQGSRRNPYSVKLWLEMFRDEDWAAVFNVLRGQAIFAAKLLVGEIPEDVESAFASIGLSLFPEDPSEVDFLCTCPDPVRPCKHISALYLVIGEQLDNDPFVLFELRGRSRQQVIAALRGTTEIDLSRGFWSVELPPGTLPSVPDDPPTFPDEPFTDALRHLYGAISAEAYRRLSPPEDQESV